MAVFGVTLFLSAFLFFWIQPLLGRYVLPWVGGVECRPAFLPSRVVVGIRVGALVATVSGAVTGDRAWSALSGGISIGAGWKSVAFADRGNARGHSWFALSGAGRNFHPDPDVVWPF
ncbi:MAG: hypothetical protein ACI9OD_001978 [Limisphaerales bacterium]|jgi:hypothetical protein